MKKFKGTHGNWEVKVDNEYKELRGIWSNTDDGMPVYIARTCYAPMSEPNANLIAAAPELLDTVQRLLSRLEYLQGQSMINMDHTIWIEMAKKTIDKALK